MRPPFYHTQTHTGKRRFTQNTQAKYDAKNEEYRALRSGLYEVGYMGLDRGAWVGYNLGMSDPKQPAWGAFWSLVLIQFTNALNEKGVQFLLIALGIWMGSTLQYPLSVLIVLPYVLFSPLAGWLADRFSKTRLLQHMVLLQVVALAGMAAGLFWHSLPLAVGFFTLFCVQAMFFSPAKKGLVKDMVGTRHIGFASGILEISSILALLVGQIGALWVVYHLLSRWGEYAGWEAAAWPCAVCGVVAVAVYVLSLWLPLYAPLGTRRFSLRLLVEHFAQLRLLWQDRILRYSEVGIGYFWFIAGVMMLIALQMAQEAQAVESSGHFMQILGQQKDSALLIAWISGGSIVGGVLASALCARRVDTRLTIIGGVGMALACLGLVYLPYGYPVFYGALGLAGLAAAGYLVPLNALLQDHAEDARRGDVIAAGNLVDCGLGILSVVVQGGMREAGMSTRMQCLALAVCSVLVTLYLARQMRQRS